MRHLQTQIDKEPDVQFPNAIDLPVFPEDDQKEYDIGPDDAVND